MVIGYIVFGIFIGGILGYLFGKGKSGINQNAESSIQDLSLEKALLEQKLVEKEQASGALLEEIKKQLQAAREELQLERQRLAEANESLTKSRTFFSAQEQKLKEQKEEIENLQKQMTKEFEAIASKILDEKSSKFTEQNRNNIDGILAPLKERIKDFEEKVDKSYRLESAERNTLKGSIEELMKLNKKISEEANNLTTALKGDNKTQGNWGELVLEKILEASGLQEGTNYTLQGKGLVLSDENGNRLQPDVIVHLPEEKHIIIDSKVSLIAYEKLVNAESTDDQDRYKKEHLQSIRAHITGLSNKNYQDIHGINSPDFVLLFIPIESSFAIAIQNDKALFDFAWEKRIVLVTPSTLLATLKTVASLWKQEMQSQNALDIAKRAGALYDKFVGLLDDLSRVGEQIAKTQKSYDDAMSKIHLGKGNLLNSVEAIKKLGAKASKKIDKSLLGENNNQEE